MAFTAQDYSDLARLLVEHPEWRLELRRLLLSDELLALPETVQNLVEQIRALTEQMRGQGEQIGTLAEQVRVLVEQVRALVEAQHRTTDTVGRLKGLVLELTYLEKAGAYFGPLLRRLRVVEPHTLEDTLEASLTHGEFRDLLRLDLVLSGRPRRQPEAPEVWLAVEISSVVDQGDVDRAERRAGLLRKAGYRALPVAAGEQMTRGAEESARVQQVVLLQDGQILFWEEALEVWAA
jgi:hypothetical protein